MPPCIKPWVVQPYILASCRAHPALIRKGSEQANPTVDPETLVLVCGQLQEHHKVRGMSSGGQRARTREGLVHRAVVEAGLGLLAVPLRLQPH
eukprot:scaffold314846_cov26-Tisochrysis_lutea.AAC.1